MTLEQSEKRFCETTKLNLDLTIFPFTKNTHKKQKQETIEELNKKFGFVPTPIFLVDTMIVMKQKNITKDSITCDFCSGVGQYTIRLLRYLKNKFDIDVEEFLTNNHYLTELQPENCAALVYIFGPNINLYVGDSMNLKYSTEEDKGILFFDEKNKKWFNDKVIDALLTKSDIATNREFLSYLFNNYKDKQKVVDYVNKIKSGEIKPKEKEDVHIEVITVDKVEEVIKQIKEQDKPKKTKTTTKKKEKVEKEVVPLVVNKDAVISDNVASVFDL